MSDTSGGAGWWLASDGSVVSPQSATAAPPPPFSPAYAPSPYVGPPGAGPSYAYTPVMSRGMNGMAIASMVLGILWLYWVGSILALVFGYIALNQIKTRNENGRGMAIAGVVLGWIGVGTGVLVIVIALIAAGSHSGS